jgi:DNA invertase Pin-like site-specific DNA recombinase
MRVTSGTPDGDLGQLELVLRDYAEHKGYRFAAIFHEYAEGSQSAFFELIEELQRAQEHHVVVPTLDHLSGHGLILTAMLARLEQAAGAQVLSLRQ